MEGTEVIDLKNLDKWVAWPKAKSLRFNSQKTRKLRLVVNAPERTRIDLVNGKSVTFLANVDGFKVVQFIAVGPVELVADGPCSVYSSEFEEISVAVPDAVIFTKIAERKARNPELEAMMARMNANMEKRLAIAERDLANRARALAEREDRVNEPAKPAKAKSASKAGGASGGAVPESDTGAGQSGPDDAAA